MAILSANSRTQVGGGLNKLRRQGILPGVVYGHKVANTNISVEERAFIKVYRQAGESSLIDLVINGRQPVKVLIKEVAFDPKTSRPIHIDFHQVQMDEKLTAEIPLKFIGEAKAVKELGGVLVKNLDHLKVECLPDDLVHEIEVDISSLTELEQNLHVRDIKLPSRLKLVTASDDIVAAVTAPRAQVEPAAVEAEVKAEAEVAAPGGESEAANKESETK